MFVKLRENNKTNSLISEKDIFRMIQKAVHDDLFIQFPKPEPLKFIPTYTFVTIEHEKHYEWKREERLETIIETPENDPEIILESSETKIVR